MIADQRVIMTYEVNAQHTGRVAGLDGKRVDEQMQEDDVSFGSTWVSLSSGGEPVFFDQVRVDDVEHVGPNFASGCINTMVL